MGEKTAIGWTNRTFSPWWGCSRVSPACRSCYADTWASRWGHELWRRHGERRIVGDATWRNPVRWNREAQQAGQPLKVFCASMCDVFEHHPEPAINAQLDTARARLWDLIEATPWLRWQLLTKRPENVAGMVPWGNAWPDTVWLGVSVETQRWADIRVPLLLASGARTTFLSCEPLLAQVDLGRWLHKDSQAPGQGIDWVITGGESGHRARPSYPGWVRSLRDRCVSGGVAFFHKQWGQYVPVVDRPQYGDVWVSPHGTVNDWAPGDGHVRHGGGDFTDPRMSPRNDRLVLMRRYSSKHAAGRLLDGRTWDEFPAEPAKAVPV